MPGLTSSVRQTKKSGNKSTNHLADDIKLKCYEEQERMKIRLHFATKHTCTKGSAQEVGSTKKRLPSEESLYGLKKAPRAWYDELPTSMMSKGITKAEAELCGFISSLCSVVDDVTTTKIMALQHNKNTVVFADTQSP
ncbi:hypothetical protein Tco_0111870 [Tanacetum coccineum]